VPLAETLDAFEALKAAGKIRHYGVSNFDLDDMEELAAAPGGKDVAVNQVLYNLTRRGIEHSLLPWQRTRGIPVMAYSPIEQGKLVRNKKLVAFARTHGMTPTQAGLAWLLAADDVIVIPKCSNRNRLQENIGALDVRLAPQQLAELDRLFPPPTEKLPLEML
jgi:diketogulonate reductase-like aldo/keto reductase